MKIPLLYSQWDTRWNNLLLGFNTVSTYNIHNFGCLVSDFAMIATYYGHQITPGELNERMKEKGCYVRGGGNYIWGSISRIFPDIQDKMTETPGPLTDGQLAEIRTAIDQGKPVILCIDYNPKTVTPDFHYVIAVAYNPGDENDIQIADSLGGKVHSLKDYLGGLWPSARKLILQYAVVTGPVPTATEGSILVSVADNERNVTKATYFDEICRFFNSEPATMDSKKVIVLIGNILTALEEQTRKRESLQRDLLDALKEMKNQEVRIAELERITQGQSQPNTFTPPVETPPPKPLSEVMEPPKETLLQKILSFFVTTADEYERLTRRAS